MSIARETPPVVVLILASSRCSLPRIAHNVGNAFEKFKDFTPETDTSRSLLAGNTIVCLWKKKFSITVGYLMLRD